MTKAKKTCSILYVEQTNKQKVVIPAVKTKPGRCKLVRQHHTLTRAEERKMKNDVIWLGIPCNNCAAAHGYSPAVLYKVILTLSSSYDALYMLTLLLWEWIFVFHILPPQLQIVFFVLGIICAKKIDSNSPWDLKEPVPFTGWTFSASQILARN